MKQDHLLEAFAWAITDVDMQAYVLEQYLKAEGEGNSKKKKYRSNVLLTEKEFETLRKDYGHDLTEQALDFYEGYKKEKFYKTKSDYLSIRRWVFDAVKKQALSKPVVSTYNPNDPKNQW